MSTTTNNKDKVMTLTAMLRIHGHVNKIPKSFPLRRFQVQFRHVSDLGLRSHLPPDSTEPHFTPNTSDDIDDPSLTIPDSEWEIRTGRIIFVLQRTLPQFFETGLITSAEITGTPDDIPLSASTISNALGSPILTNPPPLDSTTSAPDRKQDHEPIYSPRIRLCYTPPAVLPAPFPKTLRIEGFPLYIASSTFVKHTLKALYADLHVDIHKFIVYTPGPNHPPPPGFFTGSLSGRDFTQSQAKGVPLMGSALGVNGNNVEQRCSDSEAGDLDENRRNADDQSGKKRRVIREKSLLVGLKVSGRARVSNAANEWDITSTYTFSPLSGLILSHVINSIHPAPHQAVYDSLRSNLGKVFGWGMTERGAPSPANVQGYPSTNGAMDYRTSQVETSREPNRGGREK